ncbi:magnesium chelatase [Streptomyces sp. NBC_00103]|uniref:magnesium chelatase n=1 Tax=Streptomyces sp. NBC_00103 TaxID=2975653 RepID=UPI002255B7DA|nr:magnesium chelatase [Streptomyces sp. NBC_00103]MCX5368015.1 magnesium chelatase [Streptomyces sp. NBC_00103]
MATPPPPDAPPAAGSEASEPDDPALRLTRLLTCAAAEPALAGVLLFDLEPHLTDSVAHLFAALLGGAGPLLMLGAQTRDEDLWTRARLRQDGGHVSVSTEPGPLIEADGRDGPPQLVVVPDLTRLSVAGMRAAVQLLGADVAVVEHTGLRHIACPRARWLAVCRSEDAGRLSPHLLDRFALRVSMADLRGSRPHRLLTFLPSLSHAADDIVQASVTDDALTRVRALLGPDAGIRRELALARLARTLASLDGDRAAQERHADAAALLIGLPVVGTPNGTDPDQESPALFGPSGTDDRSDAPHDESRVDRGAEERPAGPGHSLRGPEPEEEVVGPDPAAAHGTPFPEDAVSVLRDFAPLRNLWQRTMGPAATRGAVVGSRRAKDLHDLAYVPTVREAAVHQRVRQTERFTIAPVDLRSHLRAGASERLLVLLLDHTCRDDAWDWADALSPFLQWAYTGRAAAQVIEVGGADATHELKADSFAARNVLDPRVLAALYRPAGRATPLAHGIQEAARVLRGAFQQHGSALAEAWLVVVTDGRGNVPLTVSQSGRFAGHVGAAGVEDALKAAARIGAMDRTRVRSAVVDPARDPYGSLPFKLADALGATVVAGRPTLRANEPGGPDER